MGISYQKVKPLVFCFLIASLFACEGTETTGPIPQEDLILGAWKIKSATIDGEDQPVTVPGIGQIVIEITDDEFVFSFPELNSNNFPTGDVDAIEGTWNLNLADSSMVLYQYQEEANGIQQDSIVWNIQTLTFGYLHTNFVFRPSDDLKLSNYDLIFIPK
jgi:hypothetical protein